MWKYSKDGEFSTKSAYAIANTPHEPNPSFQGQWIWKLDVLPKIVNFLWLCIHNSAPVKHTSASRVSPMTAPAPCVKLTLKRLASTKGLYIRPRFLVQNLSSPCSC